MLSEGLGQTRLFLSLPISLFGSSWVSSAPGSLERLTLRLHNRGGPNREGAAGSIEAVDEAVGDVDPKVNLVANAAAVIRERRLLY